MQTGVQADIIRVMKKAAGKHWKWRALVERANRTMEAKLTKGRDAHDLMAGLRAVLGLDHFLILALSIL